jgi:hypothetical protein
VITHQTVKRPAWKTFSDLYGDYRPRDVVLIHPPGDHVGDYCIETRTRPDTDYVHSAIERSGAWQHRVSRNRQLELKRARNKKYRKDRHGDQVATHL